MIAMTPRPHILNTSRIDRGRYTMPMRSTRRTINDDRLTLRVASHTALALLLLLSASCASAQAAKKSLLPLHQDPATSTLQQYLQRVHADIGDTHASSGSIWSDNGRFARMSTDVRAMRPHDLVQVVVAESLSSSTDGTVKNSRASNASSSVSSLFGVLKSGNALNNLINQNSSSGLNASGTSASNSTLNTTLGGEVVEVLPNGMLVIEAARQVEFNQQTQTIILRGLVRPEDISQSNQVVSTAIASLELEVKGKGIINDATHRQNILVRLLQHALIF